MSVTTIRVACRANRFKAKGNMLQGMSMGLVRARHRAELFGVIISMKGMELGKAMRDMRPGT
jgi:hypothetical protein